MRAYTATGDRAICCYYDILAVRNGDKPAPAAFQSSTYWDDVIAGRTEHRIPKEGPLHSLSELMKARHFSDDEFELLKRVLDATKRLQAIEQIAFAATQGLYNPDTQEFVSEGAPRLDFASRLVHGKDYNASNAELADAVSRLVGRTDGRTAADVGAARERLRDSIFASVAFTLITFALMMLAARIVKRNLLSPLQELVAVAACSPRARIRDAFARPPASRGARGDRRARPARSTAWRRRSRTTSAARGDPVRTRGRARAGRAGDAGEVDVPGQHEPRDPHADERDHRHVAPGAAHRADAAPARLRRARSTAPASSLLGIINDILDFSKIEAGKLELERIRFRLEDVLDNASALLRQRAQEKDIELLFDIAEPTCPQRRWMGDPLRLGQVLMNLVATPIKFTDSGEVVLAVERHRATGGRRVSWSSRSRDTGIGMTPEQTARLFQPFTQADGSTTRRSAAPARPRRSRKRLVELMGGQHRRRQRAGRGQHLPLRAPVRRARHRAARAAAAGPLRAMRVLVVDDNPTAREILRELLDAGRRRCAGRSTRRRRQAAARPVEQARARRRRSTWC